MASFPFWLVGALLSIVGSSFSNLGVNIQKYAHMREETRSHANKTPPRPYVKQPLWILGFSFVVFGSLFDLAALAFAAQSIVATVGSTSLVANIFFAHFWLKEPLRPKDYIGTAAIIAGATLAIAFGDQAEKSYTLDELRSFYQTVRFIVYVICAGGVGLACYLYIKRAEPMKAHINSLKTQHSDAMATHNPPLALDLERQIDTAQRAYHPFEKLHPITYCCLSALFSASTLIFAKSIAELVRSTTSGQNQFADWLPYICIIGMFSSIAIQTHFLATGLKYFDALFIVPVFQCFFITLGATAGGIYFGEFVNFTPLQAGMFPAGVVITMFGVYLLSSREMTGKTEQKSLGTGYISKRRSISGKKKRHRRGVSSAISVDDMAAASGGAGAMGANAATSADGLAAAAQQEDGAEEEEEEDDGEEDGEEDAEPTDWDVETRDRVNSVLTHALSSAKLNSASSRMWSTGGSVIFTQLMPFIMNTKEMDKVANYEDVLRAQRRTRSHSELPMTQVRPFRHSASGLEPGSRSRNGTTGGMGMLSRQTTDGSASPPSTKHSRHGSEIVGPYAPISAPVISFSRTAPLPLDDVRRQLSANGHANGNNHRSLHVDMPQTSVIREESTIVESPRGSVTATTGGAPVGGGRPMTDPSLSEAVENELLQHTDSVSPADAMPSAAAAGPVPRQPPNSPLSTSSEAPLNPSAHTEPDV